MARAMRLPPPRRHGGAEGHGGRSVLANEALLATNLEGFLPLVLSLRHLWSSSREEQCSPGSGVRGYQDSIGSEDRSASWLPLSVALGASVPSW